MQYTMELLAFSVLTYLMGVIGTESLAAQQITLQCSMLSIMVIMGISQAGSILISHNMGKDSKLNRAIICKTTLLFGALLMQIIGISYWIFSDRLISLYLDINNHSLHEIVLIAKNLLIIAAVTQFFDSGRNISAGLLRGYGDTKTSMWTGLVSCWVIGLPLAIAFAFSFHLGATGLRLGIMIGILYGCIQLISRLIKANQTNYFSVSYKATGDAL
ncbi:MAG: hypothetical protein H0U73_05140 [Tatlockia sp.]|nr:hypothetical protein [Tatlockia sp.]